MAVISSYVFWVIVGAIIIVLALIGYLAEGTEFANKALRKNNDSTASNSSEAVVQSDLPVEVLKVAETPSAWTDVSMQKDEKMETVHKETSIDDWLNVPNVNEIPKIDKKDLDKAINKSKEDNEVVKESTSESQEMFPDITSADLEPEATPENVESENNTDSVWK